VGPMASRFLYRPVMSALARWDAATAPRVDRFVANSAFVADRIRRYYSRAATVVYPPVDTEFFQPDTQPPSGHFLIVSALVPYKRLELAIDACLRLEMPLRIAGDGPERERLERRSSPLVTFLGPITGERLREEYRSARAVLLPGEEDFGIVPVEAQACGTPVVAYARGGALETVRDNETGILFDEPTAASLASALSRVTQREFDRPRLHAHAERFSRERHVSDMKRIIAETVAAPEGTTW
jgi:glycosyltransferase involved in cell wall biosynthesis